jgi:hypothetical protein
LCAADRAIRCAAIHPSDGQHGMSKLHLVFGGRVTDPRGLDFENLKAIDFVGMFDTYKEAEEAWRSASQKSIDDAEMKYVVVHLHRLLEPEL